MSKNNSKTNSRPDNSAAIARTQAKKARNVAAQAQRELNKRIILETQFGIVLTKNMTYERTHMLPRVFVPSKNPKEAAEGKGYYVTPTVTRTHPVRPSGELRRQRRASERQLAELNAN